MSDSKLDRLHELKELLKDLAAEEKKIKEEIIEQGGMESENYVAVVSEYDREFVNAKDVIEKFGKRSLGKLYSKTKVTRVLLRKKRA